MQHTVELASGRLADRGTCTTTPAAWAQSSTPGFSPGTVASKAQACPMPLACPCLLKPAGSYVLIPEKWKSWRAHKIAGLLLQQMNGFPNLIERAWEAAFLQHNFHPSCLFFMSVFHGSRKIFSNVWVLGLKQGKQPSADLWAISIASPQSLRTPAASSETKKSKSFSNKNNKLTWLCLLKLRPPGYCIKSRQKTEMMPGEASGLRWGKLRHVSSQSVYLVSGRG